MTLGFSFSAALGVKSPFEDTAVLDVLTMIIPLFYSVQAKCQAREIQVYDKEEFSEP